MIYTQAAKKQKTGSKSQSKTTKTSTAKKGAQKTTTKKQQATTSKSKSSSSSSKKTTATKKGATATKKRSSSKAKSDEPKTGKVKELNEQDKLKMAMKAFKWWEEEPLEEGLQWRYLEHLGVYFAEPYQPHGVKMK